MEKIKNWAISWMEETYNLRQRYGMFTRVRPIHYKGGKIWCTYMTHPDYCYEVYWRNSTRQQRCGSVKVAKQILDIADFFGGQIHEVKLEGSNV